MFLEQLSRELLNEEQRIGQLPKKFSNFLLYLRASEPVTYELLKNFTDYWWMDDIINEDGSTKEATMGVAISGGRLQFYIGKAFYNKLSISQLAFLMYHELSHYKRGHCNPSFNLGKSNHEIANICEDIYINEDANRDGTFASIPMKFVEGILMKKTGMYKGAKSNGIDKIAEITFDGMEVKESEYMSINESAELYRYLMKSAKEQNKDPKKPDGEPKDGKPKDGEPKDGKPKDNPKGSPGPPLKPKKGDIVRGPNGQYGRVTKTMGGRVREIEPLTKEEAENIVMGKSLNIHKSKLIKPILKPVLKKNIPGPKNPIDIA